MLRERYFWSSFFFLPRQAKGIGKCWKCFKKEKWSNFLQIIRTVRYCCENYFRSLAKNISKCSWKAWQYYCKVCKSTFSEMLHKKLKCLLNIFLKYKLLDFIEIMQEKWMKKLKNRCNNQIFQRKFYKLIDAFQEATHSLKYIENYTSVAIYCD